jgi:hypothetical protein
MQTAGSGPPTDDQLLRFRRTRADHLRKIGALNPRSRAEVTSVVVTRIALTAADRGGLDRDAEKLCLAFRLAHAVRCLAGFPEVFLNHSPRSVRRALTDLSYEEERSDPIWRYLLRLTVTSLTLGREHAPELSQLRHEFPGKLDDSSLLQSYVHIESVAQILESAFDPSSTAILSDPVSHSAFAKMSADGWQIWARWIAEEFEGPSWPIEVHSRWLSGSSIIWPPAASAVRTNEALLNVLNLMTELTEGDDLAEQEVDRALQSSNRAIKGLLLPAQDERSLRFSTGDDGIIKLVEVEPSPHYLELTRTLRMKTDRLLGMIAPDQQGFNLLAPIHGEVAAFRDAVWAEKEIFADVWSLGNTLRRIYAGDQLLARTDPDGPCFPSLFSSRLGDLVDTHNTRMAMHPDGARYDAARRGPAERPPTPASVATAIDVVAALASVPALIEPSSGTAVKHASALARLGGSNTDAASEVGALVGERAITNLMTALAAKSQHELSLLEAAGNQTQAIKQVANALETANVMKAEELRRPSRDGWTAAKVTTVTVVVTAGLGAGATAAIALFAEPIIAYTSQWPALSSLTEFIKLVAGMFGKVIP